MNIITPLFDKEAIARFAESTFNWRRLVAEELNYAGPVLWRIEEGTIYHELDCGIHDDEFMFNKGLYVFWAPRLVPESKGKDPKVQKEILVKLKKKFNLPEHHLSSFGKFPILLALVSGYYTYAEQQLSLKNDYARTDTILDQSRGRININCSDVTGRYETWRWGDCPKPNIGCFALAIEKM